MTEQSTWAGMWWLILLIAFVVLLIWAPVSTRREVREAKAARRAAAAAYFCSFFGHAWVQYANYRFCLRCPARETEPYENENIA